MGIPGEVMDDDPLTEPNDCWDWDEPLGKPFLDYRPDLLPTTFQPWADPGAPSMVTYFGKGAPFSAGSGAHEIYGLSCKVKLPRFGLMLEPKGQVQVHRPTFAFSEPLGSPRIGSMYLLRGSAHPYVEDATDPDWMKLWGLTPPTTPPVQATKHGATVRMWVQGPQGSGNPLAQWNYMQLVAPRYHVKHSNGTDQAHNSDWGIWGAGRGVPLSRRRRTARGGRELAEDLGRLSCDQPRCSP